MEHLNYYKDNELFFHQSKNILSEDTIYGMHAHEIYEIFYLVSGIGEFFVEGNKYPLTPGCILLIRSNEVHHCALTPAAPYERIILHFFPEIIDSLDPEHTLLAPFIKRPLGQQNYYVPPATAGHRMKDCLNDIIGASDVPYQKRLAIQSNLFIILSEMNKLFQTGAKRPDNTNEQRITDIINYINDNLFEPLSVETLCQKFFISKAHLNSLFKQYTSSTVWRYIEIKRLIHAKEMIRTGTSATAASEQCGFVNYSTFFRAYKKQFGKSPTG